jgi:dTDP-4-dehydrorhamnose 3,5-epimerase
LAPDLANGRKRRKAMPIRFTETIFSGVTIIEPQVFRDNRGLFWETFHLGKYAEAGIDRAFVQDNHSHSSRDTVRGLHYQIKHAQGKLVYVVIGEIFDVAVDIRRGSPTFGKWLGLILSEENKKQLYIPEGFAHGFCVLSETADIMYKCTDFYFPEDEGGILWADPELGIDWPVKNPIISEKDLRNPTLKDVPLDRLPSYQGQRP